MNQFRPSPWVIFQFFSKNSWRYSQLYVHHRCRWHRGGKWKKSLIIKVFIFLFGHLWEVELTYRYIFAFKFTLRSQQPDIVPIICHWCHWHQWQICGRCRWYRWQIATVINNSLATLPPVSLMPVVHLDLRISSQIFEKIRNGPNGILWGWGETDSWKKPEAKNLERLSL